MTFDKMPWARLMTLAMLAGLAGCGGSSLKQTLGLDRQAPDEFQIVRRQPLVIPPAFDLRPPAPGERGPQERTTSAQAREVLTGTAAGGIDASQSSGEVALVQDARGSADPEIRRKILEENTELVDLDESRFLMIFDWQRQKKIDQTIGANQTIDPASEAARLRAQGVSATGPVTTRTSSQPLEASGS